MAPGKKFNVLLIEDDPTEASLFCELINAASTSSFTISHVAKTLAEGLGIIGSEQVDLALVDLNLSDSRGFETFEKVHACAPRLPVIVLSGMADEEMGLRIVHAGAQDCLVKGNFSIQLLSRAMRYAIERARAEAVIEREQFFISVLLNNIPDRIYFKDRQSRFIRTSRALVEFHHLKNQEDLLGKTDFDVFTEEHARPAFEDEQEIMRTGEPVVGKIEKETLADGRIGWSLTTKMPLHDPRGEIIGTFGISRDITRIKVMEDALAADRNLLRNVIDNLPDRILLKDSQGHYLLTNAAEARFLGVADPKEPIGKTLLDFVKKPELIARVAKQDEEILRTGIPLVDYEEDIELPDGTPKYYSLTKVPLRDENSRILGLICIGRDITEQKLAQEQLVRANESLFAAVSDLKNAHEELRAVQLQLIEAEKMKSIGRLAAGVAHEVKNPLAIIDMGVAYLSQQDFSQDSNVPIILKDISEAVKRADSVIRGLLDFSAPKNLEVRDEDLNSIIEHSLLLVRGEMNGESRYLIVRELQPDLPLLQLDRMKMGQVFVNVFINAIHAMPEGGTITVRTYTKQLTGVGENLGANLMESFDVGSTLVLAEVEDSGTGVPEDKLTKVFDPFFTTKPTGKGTGLGLSVTRSIIDLHGGIIEIRNRPGGGAMVTMMFEKT
jgi:PAS domain S-box-containing protein